MEEKPSRAGSLTLIGGELALDFANTSSGRGDDTHQEHLQRPENVAEWAGHAKVLSPRDARWLADEAASNKPLGRKLFSAAFQLREDIYAIGAELAAGRAAPRDRVQRLTRTHALALTCAHLTPIEENFGWTWAPQDTPVEAVIGPVSLSALTLLQQAELSRVKQCQGDKCGWLFFDATKNKRRRWCEMEVCGNRAKQKRLSARRRAE